MLGGLGGKGRPGGLGGKERLGGFIPPKGGLGGWVPPEAGGSGGVVPPRQYRSPGLAAAVAAEHDARDDQHGFVGGRVEREAAERNGPRAAQPYLVIDVGGIEYRAEPFLPGGKPVFPRRQRYPRGLAPADQPGTVLYPGDHVRLANMPEKIPWVGYGDGTGAEPPGLQAAQRPHAVVRVT